MPSFETPRPRRRTRAPDPLIFTAPSILQRFADDDEVEAGLDLLLQDPRRWRPTWTAWTRPCNGEESQSTRALEGAIFKSSIFNPRTPQTDILCKAGRSPT